MPPMTKEISIQIACNLLLEELSDIYIFRHYHVANEGKRSVQYQMKLKKMGFKAGVPDFVIDTPFFVVKGNIERCLIDLTEIIDKNVPRRPSKKH